jgi:hypothetical protein
MFNPNPDPDFYPSRITDPKPRIPDPGTQIPDPTTAKYEKRGKICCPTVFFVATNITKFILFLNR